MNEKNKDAELVFGLVCPVGTDLVGVKEALNDALKQVNYNCESFKMSSIIEGVNGLSGKTVKKPEDDRINTLMTAGDEIRSKTKDGGALASLSMISIRMFRREKNGSAKTPMSRQAYLLDSLKHPMEVIRLRESYGDNFWLISAYSPLDEREAFLAGRLADSRSVLKGAGQKEAAQRLIDRDQEEGDEYGQNVRKTFPLGDVFIDTRNKNDLKNSMKRFIELIFESPKYSPYIQELGMFYAQASALKSASLARQVGAAITDDKGNILATGSNEVPKYGGGLSGPDDENDVREIAKGFDSNTKKKLIVLKDFLDLLFLDLLSQKNWLSEDKKTKSAQDLADEMMKSPSLKDAQLMNLTEFGREVHAEMAALIDASRKTISILDGILYCTTFPCHVCTKHIVAAGIKKVIYVEPYPKSLAEDLFRDFITVDKVSEDKKVTFQPFVGIAPRRFMDLFSWLNRKKEDGSIIDWIPLKANPRFSTSNYVYLQNEISQAKEVVNKLTNMGLKLPIDLDENS